MQGNDSNHLKILKQQGLTLMQRNRLIEAKNLYQQVCETDTNDIDAWLTLSSIHGMMGNLDEAEECCRKVIALHSENGQAHLNLGNIFYLKGDLDAAAKEYKNALRINPNDAAVYNNLGNIYKLLGNIDEARESFQVSARLNPNNAETHSNLGNIFLLYKGQFDEALSCYKRALQINPNLVQAHIGLGNVYTLQGRLDEALTCYQNALRHDPNNAIAHSNMLFLMSYRPDYDVATLFAEHVRWGDAHGCDPKNIQTHTNIPDENKRLRIGYVSPDFRNHPIGIFIEQVLANHDKSRFEIYCYYNHGINDDLTARLRKYADQWRDIIAQPDEALAKQIRRDGIDILIDLAGHTSGNRLLTFALKPAPIQITWMSYIATTGLKTIDYIIGNRYVIPAEDECFYTEHVARLPHHFLCFSPPRLSIAVSPLPALSRGQLTFGCFNNTAKITPSTVATWSRLLLNLPNSKLFLKSAGFGTDAIRQRFLDLFARHGIQKDRLHFEGRSPRNEYLAAYNEVDIGLDPFPYNGGTTTVEALWMGVPIITLYGDRFAGHMGKSIMMNLALGEFVAEDTDQYIEKAIALGSDLPRLATLRSGLRQRLLNSPLCDGPGFTRDLEKEFRRMWKTWCQTHHHQT